MKKVFDLWAGLLATILLSVPVIGAIIQISHEAAKISYIDNHAIVACVILVAGYAIVWKTFKTIDKVAGQLGDVVSSATAKARKGLADYRENTSKRRREEAINGQRNIAGARMATGFLRRARLADQGGFTPGARAQARYRAATQHANNNTIDEMMKRDNGRSGGDDDLMEIAMMRGMTEQRAEQMYAARLQARGVQAGEAQRRAREAVAGISSNFGAKLGTNNMRAAAYKSLLNSKTSYTDASGENGQDTWERIVEDGNALMADGIITSTDATMFAKQRADRSDRSGVGFGGLQGQFERSFERYQQGARRGGLANTEQARQATATLAAAGLNVNDDNDNRTIGRMAREAQAWRAAGNTGPFTAQQQAALDIMDNQLVSVNEARNMRKEALFGTQAGGVVAGRHEAVSALSGTMAENVEETAANYNNAQAIYQTAVAAGGGVANPQQQAVINAAQQQRDQAQEQMDRELAAIAGRYDAMGQISPQNATIMANSVMGRTIAGAPLDPATGRPMTVQTMIEQARGRSGFLEMRREYMNAGIAAANAAAAGAAAAGATGAPGAPGAPGT